MADLRTIDALARLQLGTKRFGWELRIYHPSSELVELIYLSGLSGVLRVELERQAEEREQALRVEEERQLDDPAI